MEASLDKANDQLEKMIEARKFLAPHLSELAGCSERTSFRGGALAGLLATYTQREKASPRGAIFPQRFCAGETEARKMRRIVLLLAIVWLALVTARSLAAGPQRKGTATVTGVVLGPDDKPVPHAAVTYQSSGGNAPHAVHADAHGRFTITKLRADNYDMRASARGVFSEWQKNVTVHSGHTKNVTLRLIYAKEVPKAYVETSPNPH